MELEYLIEELRNQNFSFQKLEYYDNEIYASKLLKIAQVLYNKIGNIKNEGECQRLKNKLDSILVAKIKKLNPTFDEGTINKMLNCFKRGIYKYPIDIFVASHGIFSKEGTYDDYGCLYKIKTFMFRGIGDYFNIFNAEDFLIEYPFSFPDKVSLTNEQDMMLSKFICDSINNLLMPTKENRIVRPIYELNTDRVFYGVSGITQGEINDTNIYLSKNYPNIALSILNGEECDIEMLTQKEDDITVYIFHQEFKDNIPVWCGKRIEAPVWRLSEEAIRQENLITRTKKIK